MNSYLRLSVYLLLLAFFYSCGVTHQIKKEFSQKEKDNNFFKGFVLYDPVTKKQLINHNGNKFFTPASNTKLYTFYAAYRTFKDSVKSFEYYKTNDSLIIKGTADPSLFYGFDSTKIVDFLKKDTTQIYLLDVTIEEKPYGSGWAWDDYAYYYQPEKNLFPIYGNIVTYGFENDSLTSYPQLFKNQIKVVDSTDVDREVNANLFYIEKDRIRKKYVPFITNNELTARLLEKELNKKVSVIPYKNNYSLTPFYGTSYDSLYKQLLVISDNFIAEQLMLQVGNEKAGSYSVEKGISYALENYLNDLPQKPRWVDGSGLSRYNLFTPEDMVFLLNKMYTEIPTEKLFNYFPVGGESGTLKNWYANDKPFVYAKSGTLSNNYNLSGYIVTKKSNMLIFSYMNNHYMIPLSEVKKEIEATLLTIYNNY
jgi:D-alanyl-D-alanine carboxypeptidase/D-alanyl-D-alanine-endopeptidase (penicillin-binding protein 4)